MAEKGRGIIILFVFGFSKCYCHLKLNTNAISSSDYNGYPVNSRFRRTKSVSRRDVKHIGKFVCYQALLCLIFVFYLPPRQVHHLPVRWKWKRHAHDRRHRVIIYANTHATIALWLWMCSRRLPQI